MNASKICVMQDGEEIRFEDTPHPAMQRAIEQMERRFMKEAQKERIKRACEILDVYNGYQRFKEVSARYEELKSAYESLDRAHRIDSIQLQSLKAKLQSLKQSRFVRFFLWISSFPGKESV
jgi:chromosome segregation ATPase